MKPQSTFTLKQNTLIPLIALLFLWNIVQAQQAPKVLPTKEQVAWANAEMGVIIHLDINIYAPETFDYKKTETLPGANAFNPTHLNTDQWIKTAKAAGAKYAVLTVKHGTGFCLWPSKVNAYNVGSSQWKNGQGDVLKDFIASCKKFGIKPGLYYNTNMNTFYDAGYKPFINDSARRAYNKAVLLQLTELWSNYGEMFEIWFDGGITTDKENGIATPVMQLLQAKQPQAILFQGPLSVKNIIRWIGNEDGIAAYPQWSRTNATTASDGIEKIDNLHGEPQGMFWCPGESDFPIRRNNAWNGGWLYKAGEEKYLFTVNELQDKYYKSVGRNTNMLMGMVVNTDGLIPYADSLLCDSLGKRIKMLFSKPVATVKNVIKKDFLIKLARPEKLHQLVIEEDIAKGENILSYSLGALINKEWKEIATGESVGHKRIQTFEEVTASELRFTVKKCAGEVAIKQITLY